MKIVFLSLIGAFVAAGLLYLAKMRNRSITFYHASGFNVAFSRNNVRFGRPPDQSAGNAATLLAPYVAKLFVSHAQTAAVIVGSVRKDRAFSLIKTKGTVEAQFAIDWQDHPERQSEITAFFSEFGIQPCRTYLARNGGVKDASKIFVFQLKGDANQITSIAGRIVPDILGISEIDPVQISFIEK